MRPLAITALLDASPGHEKQTKAVVGALGALTPIDVSYVTVDRRTPAIVAAWMRCALCLLPSGATCSEPRVDLIIGTGSRTHAFMLHHKRRHPEARTVCCMMPDFPLSLGMDLCLVPQHDEPPTRRNIFTTIGPPCLLEDKGVHDPRRVLLLVGGVDEKSHFWDSDRQVTLVRNILTNSPDLTWTISTSPRTPNDTTDKLIRIAGSLANVTMFRVEETPAGWIERQYAENGQVWVTADSVSMVYEALTAGCQVVVLPVAWKKKNNKFQRSIDLLVEKNLVREYQDGDSPGPGLRLGGGGSLREADRCAEEILRRWFPDRLATVPFPSKPVKMETPDSLSGRI